MTSFAYFSDVNSVALGLGGTETGYIGRAATINGYIYTNDSTAGAAVLIEGAVYDSTHADAVSLTGKSPELTISATGTVASLAQTGQTVGVDIEVFGGGTGRFFNAGLVTGRTCGLFAGAYTTADACIVRNSGTISGGDSGIQTYGSTGGTIKIINSGTISGIDSGITYRAGLYNYPEAAIIIANTGQIDGGTAGIETGNYSDRLTNTGVIKGNVDLGLASDTVLNIGNGLIDGNIGLGDGADSYDGRHGSVTGAVFGGVGADTFIGNANEAETFNGGTDTDTLIFRFGPAVTVSLDGAVENDGAALGDTYVGIENVIGSTKADYIRGDGNANSLIGQGGADTILGMNGNDTIRGGFGGDTLTGGLGNDTFRYSLPEERGDVITDFHNVAGDNDQFQISAAGFGGGLVAGAALPAAQFQVRADNVAQDSNDRFIFRTTDQTLWFDVNGNGAGGAVLIADLQAGATMTAADIILI